MARVTLVVNGFDSASETFLVSLVDGLRRHGHEVTVHGLLEGRSGARPGAGRSVGLPALTSPRGVLAALAFVLRHPGVSGRVAVRTLRRWGPGARSLRAALQAAPVAATRPDVVHVSFSPIAVELDDALCLLDAGTSVVVSCRGSGELVRPTLVPGAAAALGETLGRAAAVHVVADAVGDVVRSLGVPEERVHLIRPAVDLERFTPRSGTRRADDDPGPLVVSVGRLHWVKDQATLLRAFADLRRRHSAARLVLVGDGPEREALVFLVDQLGLVDAVELTGSVPPDRVRELLDTAAVAVCSSRSEGTSNAVLEAMALGIPVVSTRAGGMPEVLDDGQNSLLCPVGDPGSLSTAIDRVLSDPDLALRLGRAGRESVTKGHDVVAQREQFARMYEALG